MSKMINGKMVGKKSNAQKLEEEKQVLQAERDVLNWQKLQAQFDELKKKYNESQSQISELKEKIKCFERNEAFYNTKEDIIRAILDEKAKGKPPIMIIKNLERKHIYEHLSKVETICENISDLPLDMQEYYQERRENIKKMRKIDDEFERTNDIETLNMVQGTFLKLMDRFDSCSVEDFKEIVLVGKEIVNLVDKKGKFNKELIKDDLDSSSDDVKTVRSELKKRNERIMQGFDPKQFTEVN